ncbi:MAG: hypothetical protein QXG50_00915 [Desulfurococcaceae archaeon]
MVTIVGKINEKFLRSSEVYAVGLIKAGIIIADNEIAILGGGKIEMIASRKCIVAAIHKPLVLGNVYCNSIVAIGSRNPVAIGYLRADKLYARKTYIDKLKVTEANLSELCVIGELEYAEKLTFMDPHLYIRKIGELRDVYYAYKPVDIGD